MVDQDGQPVRPSPKKTLNLWAYINQKWSKYQQTAPYWWVDMNALTVLFVVALAACSSGQIITHPGYYGLGYHRFLPAAVPAPVTLKTVAPSQITLNNVASPIPLSYNIGSIAPVAPVQTQYHAQNELGEYSFGFAGGPHSRVESRDAFGIVRGSFNYINSEGEVDTQHYIADGLGFRVSGTNLPVAPEAPVLALPEPVVDTPEVTAAKAAHLAAHQDARIATAEAYAAEAPVAEAPVAEAPAVEAPSRRKRAVVAAAPGFSAYSPLRFSYGFSSPLTYGRPLQYTAGVPAFGFPAITNYAAAGVAPAFTPYAAASPVVNTYSAASAAIPREGTLLRVVNNPNHAVSYRVD